MKIIVPGEPVAKGRPRMTRNGHVYTPQKTRDYENRIKHCFYTQGGEKLNGPIELIMNAYFTMPKNAKRYMCRRPDIDNIVKTIDALNGIAFDDDRQIIKVTAEKFFSVEPRLEIELKEMGDTE